MDKEDRIEDAKVIAAALAIIAFAVLLTFASGAFAQERRGLANEQECMLAADMVLSAHAMARAGIAPEHADRALAAMYARPVEMIGGKWPHVLERARRFARTDLAQRERSDALAEAVMLACVRSAGNLDAMFGAGA